MVHDLYFISVTSLIFRASYKSCWTYFDKGKIHKKNEVNVFEYFPHQN